MRSLLEGKFLGHPLHPLLAHIPIGLFLFSLGLDLLSQTGKLPRAADISFVAMAAGVAMGLVAAAPGLADWSGIRADHPARRLGLYHMALNVAALALYAVNLVLRRELADSVAVPPIPLALSLVTMGVLSLSAYLGGRMVYDDGIAVGRHRHNMAGPSKTIQAQANTDAEGLVPVADLSQLPPGAVLRVDVHGTVMLIANQEGALYAVQEFCTHRYGPLSEGEFRDGKVTCPWHRSCFDLATGKVISGPAKEDLKSFEVLARDGKAWIRP